MTIEVKDLREAERFETTVRVVGSFGASEIAVLNVAETGVKVSHPQPLRIGTRARLWFRCGDVSVATQARIVWSHLSKEPSEGGKLVYHSGLHIDARDPAFAEALQSMLDAGHLRRDLESLERKRKRLEQREREKTMKPTVTMMSAAPPDALVVTPDQALLIQHARDRMRANPQEVQRWAARARTAETAAHSDDVLAVWEYLERSIDLAKIARHMGI